MLLSVFIIQCTGVPSRHRHAISSLSPWIISSDRWLFRRLIDRLVHHCDIGRVTIDVLPDVALLNVFDFYENEAEQIVES